MMMPNAIVKSYAEKSGKSVDHVEAWWDAAKKQAMEKFGKKGPKFWSYVNAIVRRRAGLSENLSFKEYLMLVNLNE